METLKIKPKKLVLDVESEFHRLLKLNACMAGKSMRDFVVEILTEAIKCDTEKKV